MSLLEILEETSATLQSVHKISSDCEGDIIGSIEKVIGGTI